MITRRPAVALLPVVTLLPAGCSDGAGPRVSAGPARLELVREWTRPTLSPETDWLTHPQEMAFDSVTGHLFVQDRDWKTVVEIESDGTLVRSYGRLGEGPGEIGHASGIAIDDERLYVADNGNLKILVFRRADAGLEQEFRIPRFYRDLVVLEGPRILVVPGDDHAVEALDLEGAVVGGLGDPEVLPGSCTGCALAVLPDGRAVVLDGDRPEMWVFSERETSLIDLHGMPLLVRWREEVEDRMRRIRRMGGGRIWMWNQLDVAGPSHVTVSAGPPGITETGNELWRIDIDSGNIERYDYGEPLIGMSLAIDWPRVFTVDSESAAIVEYRAPEAGGR